MIPCRPKRDNNSRSFSVHPPTMMVDIEEFHARQLDQDIDTAEIIPGHSDYVVVGTYHLHKRYASEGDQLVTDATDATDATRRSGSIQIVPFDQESQPDNYVPLKRLDLEDTAVVDIHFHPLHPWLLGAATSIGEIRFYAIKHEPEVASRFSITELGKVKLSTDEAIHLITYFEWLPHAYKNPVPGEGFIDVFIAACDSSGESSAARIAIPISPGLGAGNELDVHRSRLHKPSFALETWYITSFPVYQSGNFAKYVILSGGDDAALVASQYSHCHDVAFEETRVEIQPLFTDRKTHTAGITSILVLPAPEISKANTADVFSLPTKKVLMLTGSYDDTLRLFSMSRAGLMRKPDSVTSLELGGGVWRINLLDSYTSSTRTHGAVASPKRVKECHYILLISLMYAGVRIVRLTIQQHDRDASHLVSAEAVIPNIDDKSHIYTWAFSKEASFTKGHESMVYACVAKAATDEQGKNQRGDWDVLSTSFYDRKLCNWRWRDEVRHSLETAIVQAQEAV